MSFLIPEATEPQRHAIKILYCMLVIFLKFSYYKINSIKAR